MSATQDYLKAQIADAVSKALGFAVDVQIHGDGTVVLVAKIEGPSAAQPFWQAVLEQFAAGGLKDADGGISDD